MYLSNNTLALCGGFIAYIDRYRRKLFFFFWTFHDYMKYFYLFLFRLISIFFCADKPVKFLIISYLLKQDWIFTDSWCSNQQYYGRFAKDFIVFTRTLKEFPENLEFCINSFVCFDQTVSKSFKKNTRKSRILFQDLTNEKVKNFFCIKLCWSFKKIF